VPGAAQAVTGQIDVDAVLARRNATVSGFDDAGQIPWLDGKGITLLRGTGRITDVRRVSVTAADGSVSVLEAATAVVIATGTSAAIPPIPGLGESVPWDNRAVTATMSVPRRLLVLGGGAIGAEMAQAMRSLGTEQVTVVEGAARLLPREEPFAGDELGEAFAHQGIVVITGVAMEAVRRDADGTVTATLVDGRELVADEILVAVGRRPATGDLGLDVVGLEPGRPVPVDDQLRAVGVTGGWLYAVGDCNGRSLLTHMGKYQARIAGDVILGKDVSAFADHRAVPRVTFTDPQVCAVGLTAAQADEAGIRVRVVDHPVGAVAGAYVLGDGVAGTARLVVDEDRIVVVGATFTGPGIAELLHSATIAIVGEVPVDRLWHAVPSFPTLSEVWLRLLEAYGL
jgi:dihydrolipoamide dehydrogenase